MILPRVLNLVAAIVLAGCASTNHSGKTAVVLTPGDSSAPSQVTPTEALAIARRFTEHPWQPFAKNILHGKDRDSR